MVASPEEAGVGAGGPMQPGLEVCCAQATLQPSSEALFLPETCPSLCLSDPPFSSENSPALLESENPLSPSEKRGTLLLLLREV